MKEYNDEELVSLANEQNEEAKDILFKKYSYIIDVLLNKNSNIFKKLNLDSSELYSEALIGFSDALTKYNAQSSLSTFISLCINRRLMNFIRLNTTRKKMYDNNSLSLDYLYEDVESSLNDIVEDFTYEPLSKITNEENYVELINKIKKVLSESEYEVFIYLTKGLKYSEIALILNKTDKQIDNTIQRIKIKVKSILDA